MLHCNRPPDNRSCPNSQRGHDMSKAKTAGEKATATAESAMENGAAALKTGLEKSLKGYDAFVGYGKETTDAFTKPRPVAGKGIERIHSGICPCPRHRLQQAVEPSIALRGP